MAERAWVRFNFMEPIKVIDRATGKPTGKSVVCLRAIRSDSFLYHCSVELSNEYAERREMVEVAWQSLRQLIDAYLNDDPNVPPLPDVGAFKGAPGWIEATIN